MIAGGLVHISREVNSVNKLKASAFCLCLLLLSSFGVARAQDKEAAALPYSPSLNLNSLDKSIDPCQNFYKYACGRWQKENPIPADQTSWSVYGKLYQDNLNFLRVARKRSARNSKRLRISSLGASWRHSSPACNSRPEDIARSCFALAPVRTPTIRNCKLLRLTKAD